jgi:hypothetical protein
MNRQRPVQVLLWVMLSLSTLGFIDRVTQPTAKNIPTSGMSESAVFQDEEVSAFATAFARQWLTWNKQETSKDWQLRMQPFVTSSLLQSGQPVSVGTKQKGQQVDDVFPTHVQRVGPSAYLVNVDAQTSLHALIALTVSVELDADAQTFVTAWPILHPAVQSGSLSTPSVGPAAPDSMTATLKPVVTSFLQTYFSGKSPTDLAQFVAQGSTIQPLQGILKWTGLQNLQVYGAGPYTVIATAEGIDTSDGVNISQTYALKMIQNGGKWFVSSLEP